MAYFSKKTTVVDRVGKITADIFCAALLAIFSIVFFGPLGGAVSWVILELGLLVVDYLVPNAEDDAPGSVVR
jgi:hypothetical protein